MVDTAEVRREITGDEVRRLRADGFLRFGKVLTDDELAEAREHVDRVVAARVAGGERPEYIYAIHACDEYFGRLASHPRLLDILEPVLGPDIVLLSTHLLCKPPEDGHAVAWHQDGAFAPLEPMSLVSLYLALDDCDAGNGCMRMLPGSHRGGPVAHDTIRDGAAARKQIPQAIIDAYEPVPMELRAGECSLHLPWVIHGSESNRSDRRRAGLPMRYIDGATRIVHSADSYNPEPLPGDAESQIRVVRGRRTVSDGAV